MSAADTYNETRDKIAASREATIRRQSEEIDHLRGVIRAIELRVDALNIKGFTPRPAEKAAFEDIKSRCRDALKQ